MSQERRDSINQRRINLTPELRRLQIQTRQDYTVSGRTRQASSANSTSSSPRFHTLGRTSPVGNRVGLVPIGSLVDREEFDSDLLTPGAGSLEDFGNLSFVEIDEAAQRVVELDREVEREEDYPDEDNDSDEGQDSDGSEAPVENRDQVEPQPRIMAEFNLRQIDGLIPLFDGKAGDLDRFVRGVELAIRLTDVAHHPILLDVILVKLAGRAQILSQEGRVYADWAELKAALKHRFKTPRPTKAVRKALEALYQKPKQSVRDFALEVEDVLAEFLASDPDLNAAQRAALAVDREAQALEVFVDGLDDKLRDWAKARDFATLQAAVDFAVSEEHNIRPRAVVMAQAQAQSGPSREVKPARPVERARPGNNGCFICNQPGHQKRDCPKRNMGFKKEGLPPIKCERCHRTGHMKATCWVKVPGEDQQPSGSGTQFVQTNGGPKNSGSSSAGPTNIRSLQASVQVHAEPRWNEIVAAPEPSNARSE